MRRFHAFPIKDITELSYMDSGEREPCTGKQRAFIYSLLNQCNLDEGSLLSMIGIDRYGIKQFSKGEASEAIDLLKEMK